MGRCALNWTNPKIQQDLRRLGPAAFARKYPVSYQTVASARRRFGVPLLRQGRPPKAIPADFDHNAHLPLTTLAARYRVNMRTALNWRLERGFTMKAMRAKRNAKLADRARGLFRDPGATMRGVAGILGVHQTTLANICRTHGVRLSRDPHGGDRATRRAMAFITLVAAGFTLEQIGEIASLTRERVRQIVDAQTEALRLAAEHDAKAKAATP